LVHALVLLHRFSVDMTETAHQSLGRDAVENSDIQVLVALHQFGPQTPTTLGAYTGASRSTVARVLTRLEAGGLITRNADARDARSVRIALSARGRRRVNAFSDGMGDRLRASEPLFKEVFHELDGSAPAATPGRAVDPLLSADALSRAGARFVEDARPALEAYGAAEFANRFTLCLLRMYGVQRPTQLADELLLTPSGTSGVLTRLEQAGLITRRHDLTPGDRRAVVVELTARGQQAMAEMLTIFKRHVPAMLQALRPWTPEP
jgi:DNA-binding MarR family transcriptional regulator